MLALKRHARALDDLTPDEGASLGRWLPLVTAAMHEATGCEVENVIQLAEGEGFHHVHFHLMARTAAWPTELRGLGVFGAFGAAPHVSADDQAALVEAMRAALARRG